MPPVLEILGFINLAMKAAPTIEKIAKDGGALIKSMIDGGQVTAEQQAKVSDWADAHMKATLAGEIPPELQVEAEPTPTNPPTV